MNAMTTRLKLIQVDGLKLLMILLATAGLGASAYLMWATQRPALLYHVVDRVAVKPSKTACMPILPGFLYRL